MNYATIIAVDPGASGAAVTFDAIDERLEISDAYKGLDTAIEVLSRYRGTNTLVVIEKVHASPVQSPATAFKFGQYTRDWYAVAKTLGLDILEVAPEVWQRPLGLTEKLRDVPAGQRYQKAKAAIHEIASSLYPKSEYGIRITLTNADAIMIGRWAVRQYKRLPELVANQTLDL